MGETEVRGRVGLVIRSEFVPPQPIKKLVEMGLPLIKRLIFPDQLGKGISILQHISRLTFTGND